MRTNSTAAIPLLLPSCRRRSLCKGRSAGRRAIALRVTTNRVSKRVRFHFRCSERCLSLPDVADPRSEPVFTDRRSGGGGRDVAQLLLESGIVDLVDQQRGGDQCGIVPEPTPVQVAPSQELTHARTRREPLQGGYPA